jgi:HEAT repeat protein
VPAWSVAAWLFTTPAIAGAQREAVLDLLQAFDERVGRADLAKLGAGVEAELMGIADDPSVPTTRRGNAVVALQWYPSDAVRSWLVARLRARRDPGEDLLRRKAASALSAFGPSAVSELVPALADADPQLRVAVARALGTIADPAGRSALEARLAIETEQVVRSALQDALQVPLR